MQQLSVTPSLGLRKLTQYSCLTTNESVHERKTLREFAPRLTERPGNETQLSCFLGPLCWLYLAQLPRALSTLSESQSRHSLLINIPVPASSRQPTIQMLIFECKSPLAPNSQGLQRIYTKGSTALVFPKAKCPQPNARKCKACLSPLHLGRAQRMTPSQTHCSWSQFFE